MASNMVGLPLPAIALTPSDLTPLESRPFGLQNHQPAAALGSSVALLLNRATTATVPVDAPPLVDHPHEICGTLGVADEELEPHPTPALQATYPTSASSLLPSAPNAIGLDLQALSILTSGARCACATCLHNARLLAVFQQVLHPWATFLDLFPK
ncbi:hypothetical protein Adt_04367 [Abeliophyllum distichum]|uniref:Uncharacterized protein n=1 Tax=Abeliophyllum distichum TaxID=126358 RepID=A0ABD1W139_9LAMI